MDNRINAGDRCRIIAGFTHRKSPNIGKVVVAGADVVPGEWVKRWGRGVQVSGPEVYQMDDAGNFVNVGWALVPVAWLEKLPPEDAPPVANTVREELHV